MNLSARLVLALLTLNLAVLSPVPAGDLVSAIHHKASCRAIGDNPCQHCPMAPTSSGSSTTCCSAQAPCFVGYANASDDFVAGMQSVNVTHLTTDRVFSRSQRPPVPPPRIELS